MEKSGYLMFFLTTLNMEKAKTCLTGRSRSIVFALCMALFFLHFCSLRFIILKTNVISCSSAQCESETLFLVNDYTRH
jgi:hypothetical protein